MMKTTCHNDVQGVDVKPTDACSSSTSLPSSINDPVGFENLVSFMSSRKQGWVIKIHFRVDFAHGVLTIRKLSHDYEDDDAPHRLWSIDFCYDILNLHNVTKYFDNERDVVQHLHDLGTARFVRPNQFLSVPEYDEYVQTFTMISNLAGREMETCYVCQEPTYGHKTRCRHDICLSCFYKSCKQTSRFNSFRCGICRQDWKSYNRDHEEYTDDDEDDD